MIEDQRTVFHNIGLYLSMKELRKGAQSLSLAERIYFVVYQFDCELLNGGIDQYLFNSSGNYANEAISAFSKIGAARSSELVEKLMSFFPEQRVPTDRGERMSLLKNLMDDTGFMELEREITHSYWEDEDNVTSLLILYYENNREDFDPIDFDVPLSLFDAEPRDCL